MYWSGYGSGYSVGYDYGYIDGLDDCSCSFWDDYEYQSGQYTVTVHCGDSSETYWSDSPIR